MPSLSDGTLQGAQMTLLDPGEELAFAKTCVEGMELSAAAQALYDKEGAARFKAAHGRRVSRILAELASDLSEEGA